MKVVKRQKIDRVKYAAVLKRYDAVLTVSSPVKIRKSIFGERFIGGKQKIDFFREQSDGGNKWFLKIKSWQD